VSRSTPVRQWTLRRRIGLSFAISGLLLAVLVAAVVASTVAFVRSGSRVVYHWQPAVSAAGRLQIDVVEQEASLRGYALSHDPAQAAAYRRSVAAEGRDNGRLGSLLGEDDDLRHLLSEMSNAIARWQNSVAEPALAAIEHGDPAAERLVVSATATRLFAEVRSDAVALAAGIDTRAATARTTRHTAGVVFVVAIVLSGLILAMLAIAIWRGLHRWVLEPVDELGAQTRQIARGDTYRQIAPAGPAEFARLGRDVEEMRLQIAGQLARAEEIQEELRARTAELSRSNDELQQFAYVASHDLSEPLRKVANFCQLLERQYRDELDDRAKQYIDFAVDGAKRMQALISDLLALSRVGRTTDEFVPVPLDAALDGAVTNLADRIAETDARIERDGELPTVSGDQALLTSLFENLLDNAIKYARDGVAPVVRVSAELDDGSSATPMWTVTVSDNGIGIEAQYADRIFAIFQRLHVRDSYGGTGIGLALCRRIVEFHGGRIWLDDVQSSHGATFKFALPEGGVVAEPRD
jgi:signal transduction histidine kinase